MNYSKVVQSWYPLATSDSVKPGKSMKLEALGISMVLFRTTLGELGLLHRNCAHMGGDLTQGTVTSSGIRCPVHSWEFTPSGVVVINNATRLNSKRKPCQQAIVCCEKFGIILGYFGDEPAFDLPAPAHDVFHSPVYTSETNFRYDIPSVFGFDSEHFETVHKRGIDSLVVYQHHEAHLGTRITASVDGQRFGDRIMRRLGMTNVNLDIDFWAANILFGQHMHSNTFVFLAAIPIDEHVTRMYVTIMQKRNNKNLVTRCLGRLRFAVARPVTRAFIAQDEKAMEGIRFDRYSPFISRDSAIHNWLEHCDALPTLSSWSGFST